MKPIEIVKIKNEKAVAKYLKNVLLFVAFLVILALTAQSNYYKGYDDGYKRCRVSNLFE
jgi:hypothetical protein